MEIRRITEQDIALLIKYGYKIYPTRHHNYASIVNLLIKDKIGDYTGGLIILNDKNEICGQILITATHLKYQGESYPTGWGYDLIIDENLRNDSWGIDLMMTARKAFKNYCATGSNPTALKLHLKLGYKQIGEIRKYIGLTNGLRGLFKFRNRNQNWPVNINGFDLISNPDNLRSQDYWNKNLIEFERSDDFMKWRFFSDNITGYKIYQKSNADYFIIREIKLKGIPCLLLVDFRCNLNNNIAFNKILKTVRKIAGKRGLFFILCGSSHKMSDEILEKNLFKSIGRPRPIIVGKGFTKLIDDKRVIDRTQTLVTLADSDGEVSWA